LVSAILALGERLDSWGDEDAKLRLGQWLRQKAEQAPVAWLRSTNHAFLSLFDRVYGGRGGLLEEGLWVALLFSPVALIAVRVATMVTEVPSANTNGLLLWAMALAAVLSMWYLSYLKLAGLVTRSSMTIRHRFRGGGIGLGIVVGGGVGMVAGAFGFLDDGVAGDSIAGGIAGGIAVGGIAGGIAVGSIVVGSILGGGIVVGSIAGGSILAGGIVVSSPGWRNRIRFPVHPIKALASSLFFICFASLEQSREMPATPS